MGQAAKKRKAFPLTHPACCFCGGSTPATTIDHVPSRACFKRREFPEGFEFPACDKCQNNDRLNEQAFALMCHLSDRNPENYDEKLARKLLIGIANNQPNLVPKKINRPNEIRHGLRRLGLEKKPGVTLSQIPIVSLSPELNPAMRRVGDKIGLALFYRHFGKIATQTYGVCSFWAQVSDRRRIGDFSTVVKELSGLEVGARSNTQLGDRFSYRWSQQEAGEPDIFIAVVKFGLGLVICTMVAAESVWKQDEPAGWVTVSHFANCDLDQAPWPSVVGSP